MADLDGGANRAQVLLVAALTLGVTFVALALILNSAIFTENLASRGATTGADDVVRYHGDLKHGVGAVLRFENRNASSSDDNATVLDRVVTGVSDMNAVRLRRHARRGAISNVSVVGHGGGARIFQSNASRNYTDATARSNWTVASDVTRTRAFRLNVSRTNLPDCGLLSDCFVLTVRDGSETWNVSVSDDSSGVEVRVDDGTGSAQDCPQVDQQYVVIDLTAGTVGGTQCTALSFADAPADPYDIQFTNADEIEGAYSLVVDEPSIANAPPPSFDPDVGPSVTAALYNVTLVYEYRTGTIEVAKELRVAPGETDG